MDASQTADTPQLNTSTAWLAVQVSLFAWCLLILASPGRVDSITYLRLTMLTNTVLASY